MFILTTAKEHVKETYDTSKTIHLMCWFCVCTIQTRMTVAIVHRGLTGVALSEFTFTFNR